MSDTPAPIALSCSWACPACRIPVTTPFCPQCGEKPLEKTALTLRGVMTLILDTFTAFDSKFIRTFRLLVNRPGVLTEAYVRGERRNYVGPFALFFSINAVFFVIQSLTSVNIFSAPLDSHLRQQDWSELAQVLVEERLAGQMTTMKAFAAVFDKAVVTNAKALIVLMTMPFALFLPVVFLCAKKPFMTHVAFAMHLYAFLLVLFCALMAIAALDVLTGGLGLQSAHMDNVLSVANVLACATYLFAATGRVYGAAGVARWLQVAVLTIAAAVIVVGYRFLIFLITFYGI